MGFFEKRKFRNFLIFLSNYDKDKPSTFLKGFSSSLCFSHKIIYWQANRWTE